jgi:hypothetical protein
MNRGGYRTNAGRKSTWKSGRNFEQTKLIRVPTEFASQLLEIAHKLDAGETTYLVTESKKENHPNANEIVTKSKEQENPDKNEAIDLVTQSKENRILNAVKVTLAKWRQQSNDSLASGSKNTRWCEVRQMLDELESLVWGEALPDEGLENMVSLNQNRQQEGNIDYVTESKLSDLLEQTDLVIESKGQDLAEDTLRPHSQLNLVDEFQSQVSSNTTSREIKPLTRQQIAERFEVSVRTVENRSTGKAIADFPRWSATKDPNGIAWQYSQESKLFYPVL